MMTSERERAMTVAELIEILQGMDGAIPVGVYHGAVDSEGVGWNKHVELFSFCCFTTPAIGDEPD